MCNVFDGGLIQLSIVLSSWKQGLRVDCAIQATFATLKYRIIYMLTIETPKPRTRNNKNHWRSLKGKVLNWFVLSVVVGFLPSSNAINLDCIFTKTFNQNRLLGIMFSQHHPHINTSPSGKTVTLKLHLITAMMTRSKFVFAIWVVDFHQESQTHMYIVARFQTHQMGNSQKSRSSQEQETLEQNQNLMFQFLGKYGNNM